MSGHFVLKKDSTFRFSSNITTYHKAFVEKEIKFQKFNLRELVTLHPYIESSILAVVVKGEQGGIRDGPQIELLALEHAEDREHPAVATRIAAQDSDREEEHHEEECRAAREDRVEQLGHRVATHREDSPHDRQELHPG